MPSQKPSPTLPSENWDDDFEFHPDGGTSPQGPRSPDASAPPRASTASSRFTDDWDNELHDARAPPNTTESKENNPRTHTAPQASPSKHVPAAENWDDDFDIDSPRRVPRRAAAPSTPRMSTTSSHATEGWDGEPHGVHTPSRLAENKENIPAQTQWTDPGPSTPSRRPPPPEPENWDDDFEADSPRRAARRNEPGRARSHPRLRALQPESWDDEFAVPDASLAKRPTQNTYLSSSDEEDGDDFGPTGRDEDRTVTARSRRRPIGTPPPPVPAIPAALIPFGINTNNVTDHPPPRSPVASVFTAPPHPLRHTPSRTSTGFNHLPPSPQIHKERERKRLRKKSQAPPFDDSASAGSNDPAREPPRTPQRSTSPPPPPDSASRTALLTRIGSVKKWGVRRKRASTTPSETMGEELDHTPRPPSTLASPSKGNNWLFRGSSSGSSPPPSTHSSHHSSNHHSTAPASERARAREAERLRRAADTPTPPGPAQESPTKLSKRKSLGFAQLRLGARPEAAQHAVQHQSGARHVSYAGAGSGRAARPAGSASVEDLSDSGRAWSRSRERSEGSGQGQEGSRGFMGSVRRISLSGQKKHKRMKSAAAVPSASHGIPDVVRMEGNGTKASSSSPLLPPIELRPPSPSRTASAMHVSRSEPLPATGVDALTLNSPTRLPTVPKVPVSPQSASLGRAAGGNANGSPVPRRNSLGDLKIPVRISQAQVGLRRDLGMVREFAASVEQLKDLQNTYGSLVVQVQAILDMHAHANSLANSPPPDTSRTTSPTFFSLPRPRGRASTNPPPPSQAYKQLASAFYTINSKYRISWECAELLIELGGGSTTPSSAPASSVSAPAIQGVLSAGVVDVGWSRERAITLAGDEAKPPTPPPTVSTGPPIASPPSLAWRASTGRHDLSQRQLVLLREMLNKSDSSVALDDFPHAIPEETASPVINRDWRWGDAMTSTVTLPSEESAPIVPAKKRRASRLGMTGLRDMLRSLKRGHADALPLPASTTSLSTDSSLESNPRHQQHAHLPGRRRAKTSTGPESLRSARDVDLRPVSPYGAPALAPKPSPRRPSLAAIFRMGKARSAGEADGNTSSGRVSRQEGSTGEEDWDRVDSPELEAALRALSAGADASATVRGTRGRSPYLQSPPAPGSRPVTPHGAPSASLLSLYRDVSPVAPLRATRLSNVEEQVDDEHGTPLARPRRDAGKNGSVRSMPPQARSALPDAKLAMTPENIRPLLENAREVQARLGECIAEVRLLLSERM